MATPKALIISGNGFNCERETKYAFEMAGGTADQAHMNDILTQDVKLDDYNIIAFIGGFSYGDHLGGGKVVANKFRYHLSNELNTYIQRDTLIIGICNGFQVITQLGILPGINNDYSTHSITLAQNISNRYEDRWVHLKANPESPCVFSRNIDTIFLPVRHGEGQVTVQDSSIMDSLLNNGQVVFQYIDPGSQEPTEVYPYNPNGSQQGIAGICDPTGRIFGLMPHPEAFLSPFNHPFWTRLKAEGKMPNEGQGTAIFKNAVDYFL